MVDDDLDSDDLSDGDKYVVCSKCGARIKATRERCLRCFEPLHVDPTQMSVWRSQSISDQVGILVAALAIVAIGGLIWVLYSTADTSHADTEATPVIPHQGSLAPPAPKGTTPGTAPDAGSPAAEPAPPADVASPPVDNLEDTRRSFEDKLSRNPNDPIALNGLGITQQQLGNLPEALAAFKHASDLEPRNATVRMNLAALEARMGQWDKAAVDFRVASQLTPDDYGAHYNLALALQQTHDDAAAVGEFQAAIQIAPREAAAHRGLAASFEKTGRAADAAKEYQRYLELTPDAPDAAAIRDRLQRLPKL